MSVSNLDLLEGEASLRRDASPVWDFNKKSDSIQDDTNGRDTVGTIRFGRSSTIGLVALAPLDVVVGVTLLGVHGGDDVVGLVDCVVFTRLADKTPSYCTPFNSIETTNCCSPDSEPIHKRCMQFVIVIREKFNVICVCVCKWCRCAKTNLG